MARPTRKDVDYFPFYVKDGRTLFILESKYGCKGTGFFTNVMRFLCQTPDHHFCIKEESDRLFFFAKTHCDEVSGEDMLKMMSFTRKIHTYMWVSSAVIVCPDLLESLKDAYRTRANPIITLEEIFVFYGITPVSNVNNSVSNTGNSPIEQNTVVSSVINPQTKLKETKLKETKAQGNGKLPEWINSKTWEDYLEMRKKIRKPVTHSATLLIFKDLENLKTTGNDPNQVLEQSIKNSWQGLFPLKQKGGGIESWLKQEE